MRNILKTRRTVHYFVYYNIGMFIISSIVITIYFYTRSEQLYEIMNFANQGVPQENFATVFIVALIIVAIIVVGLLALFYWFIYGILLRRLKINYTELKKMED